MNGWRICIPLSIFLFFSPFWLSAQCICTDCRCSDSLELVKLYNATNGANWTVRDTLNTKSPWILTQPMTNWFGISLTNERVTWIDLDGIADFNSSGSTGATGNGLSGQLPTLSFSELSNLDLASNQLTGNLPHMVLPKIDVISISFNPQLKGTIPTSWHFPTLQYLDMCHNGLDGTLPTLNFPNLKGLYLHVNKLTGALPTINAPLLADIRMTANQFIGCFPASYRRFCSFTYAWFDDNPGLPNAGDFGAFCSNNSGICQDTTTCRYKDSLQLVALYNTTNGANWINNTNWLSSRPINEWFGVSTNTMGCVIKIELMNNQLEGTLPNLNLTNLEELNLAENSEINGAIPNFNLPNLKTLDLNDNTLSGNIPNFNLPNLLYLNLSNNILSGTLPICNNMEKIVAFDFSHNRIDSLPNILTLPFLKDSANISRGLRANNNQLTFDDILPNINLLNRATFIYEQQDSFFKDTTIIARAGDPLSIDLNIDHSLTTNNYKWFKNNNNFRASTNSNLLIFNSLELSDTGVYRSEVTNPHARDLTLYSRKIKIVVNPPLIDTSSCRYKDSLQLVALYHATNGQNWRNKTNWLSSEPINTWFGITTNEIGCVKVIELGDNLLTGSIPNLSSPNLEYLILPSNKLTGSLPTFNLPNLRTLILFNNQLSGSIPNFNMPDLYLLDINTNNLTGTIPNFNLPKLERLNLNNNQLYGTIPTCANMVKLFTFDFYNNKIDSLPNISNLPFLQDTTDFLRGLRIYNNQLTFDDILPNINLLNRATYIYTPQDSFFKDTTIIARAGDPLSIDLNIDAGITTNRYQWLKDGVIFGTTTNSNKLIINTLQVLNAGIYTCQVTNSNAPLLALYSRKITLVVTPPIIDTSSCRFKDSLQLVALYHATQGATWSNNTNWLSTLPISEWFGVTTNATGCVDILNLASNQLKDSLPNMSFNNIKILTLSDNQLKGAIPNFNMPLLEVISLSLNELTGTIPPLNVPNLIKLDLAGNQLSGNIPNFNMPLLRYIYLQDNQLTGALPNFNMPQLIDFFVNNNKLSGNIPNFNMPFMRLLYLDRNQLSGAVPNFMMPNLKELSLYANKLSGNIPNFDMPNLRIMLLSFNELTSSVPNFNMPFLKIMDIRHNKLTGNIHNFNMPQLDSLFACCNQLSGNIPNFNLPNLKVLDISYNELNGNLPNLENLTQLYHLRINNNKLSGCFPAEWERFCTINYECRGNSQLAWEGNFQRFCNNEAQIGATCNDNILATINDKIQIDCSCRGIDTSSCRYKDSLALVKFYISTDSAKWRVKWNLLASMNTWQGVYFNSQNCVAQLSLTNNDLEGILPTELGNLLNLNYLNLSNNKIGGQIPISLGNLIGLTHLDLSFNQLNDSIPTSLGNLRKIQYFYLGGNQLTGKIPISLGNLTEVMAFMVNENQLSGAIPFELANLTKIKELLLSDNQLTGNIPSELGNLINLENLRLQNNQLTGGIPSSFQNLTQLKWFYFYKNKIDSLPNLSMITPLSMGGIFADTNRLTFDDILPNIRLTPLLPFSYAVQDSFFENITYLKNIGEAVDIDLKIDGAVRDNNYKWFKNGVEIPSLFSQKNRFILRGVLPCDAGIYTCQVTNNRAPELTLYSRKITINVNPISTITRSKTICYGQKDTLPNGQIVSPTVTTTYRDTLKSRLNPSCDSTIMVTNLTVLPEIEAIDDDLEVFVGDSALVSVTLNDKLGGQNGQLTILKSPKEGTAKRVNETQIQYVTPQILRGSNTQTLTYKICANTCPNNCDSALLYIKINDNTEKTGRIKNGVAPELSGEEYFEIDSIQSFTEAQLFVYSQSNELVFKSAIPYDNRWKGTGRNEMPLPSGVYYYVLRHATPNRKYLEGKILLLHE